jgi:hypothetical protein
LEQQFIAKNTFIKKNRKSIKKNEAAIFSAIFLCFFNMFFCNNPRSATFRNVPQSAVIPSAARGARVRECAKSAAGRWLAGWLVGR